MVRRVGTISLKTCACAGMILICSEALAFAADVPVEIIATKITTRSASRNVQQIDEVHQKMQSAINCLVGPKGEGFSASAPNPCAASGNGLIPDTSDADKKSQYSAVVAKLKTGLTTSDRGAAMQIALEAADLLDSISSD